VLSQAAFRDGAVVRGRRASWNGLAAWLGEAGVIVSGPALRFAAYFVVLHFRVWNNAVFALLQLPQAECAADSRRTKSAYERDTMVAEDDNGDEYKITLAQQIFGRAAGIAARKPPPVPKTSDPAEPGGSPVAVRDAAADDISPPAAKPAPIEESAAQPKQLKTAAELANMIELDLARHPDCPGAGFRVTVYGGSHWRAMLTITPAAGGIRNPGEWRDLTDELAERLRARYDLARE
jgi:hypothetical protein